MVPLCKVVIKKLACSFMGPVLIKNNVEHIIIMWMWPHFLIDISLFLFFFDLKVETYRCF